MKAIRRFSSSARRAALPDPEPERRPPVVRLDPVQRIKELPMIRTLIFGAIAGYVGKKLYDQGKLTEFKNDLTARYNQAKADIATQRADEPTSSTAPATTAAPVRPTVS
jgi:hypothetical protein